jgi:rhodanese-related sulfurtransferase
LGNGVDKNPPVIFSLASFYPRLVTSSLIRADKRGSQAPDVFKHRMNPMAYTEKFQAMADAARAQVEEVKPEDVDALIAAGAVALDIRDKEEHDAYHIPGSINISRGKLEMNVEGEISDLDTTILCYCNAYNRGALSAATLKNMGYRNAKFIAGGLGAYRKL